MGKIKMHDVSTSECYVRLIALFVRKAALSIDSVGQ
jgi:hypothetical protein